jgi:glycosyltransferase involved in cell wall biosynthesis
MTLFFGALNRERDWLPLMPVLNAVAARVGERLKFCVVHDQAFFDALQTPHKTFTPTCDYDAYMTLLGGCEISLMPLEDNPFNRAKSDLKFIEAGACRVAALASDVVYSDSIEDGTTGLLFRDAEELHERRLAYQVADRIAWYRDLWDRRDELTAALLARLVSMRAQSDATQSDTTRADAIPVDAAQDATADTPATV